MLKIIYADSPQAKEQFFLKNKSADDLWLVSHIEAKRTLQNIFLESQTTIFNKSVLRASEYWQWLFSINCPEWRSVSESLVFALLEQWFDHEKIDIRYNNLELFKHFFGQALPLMVSDNTHLLEEWLMAEGVRAERLTGWFEKAKGFWSFLSQKKWIGKNWVLNVLNEKQQVYLGDFNKCFIDLGLDLRAEEVEFILTMSQEKDVTVIIPRAPWCDRYESALRIYKKIILSADQEEVISSQSELPEVELYDNASVLKEVKSVVSEVRRLMDLGVKSSRIAVLSSNIEDYWDMLREHFLVEGIPVNKKYVLRAISLPSFQTWLARLNLARTDFEQSHLETYLFSDDEVPVSEMNYIHFKKEFSHIYDPQEVREYLKLPEGKMESSSLTLVEFVQFISKAWKGENREILEDVIDQMAQDMRVTDIFSYELWLKYLEMVLSRYEVEVRGADTEGVLLSNTNQADWGHLDQAFILGCEQSRLREVKSTPLAAEDIARLELDLGFYLERSESLKKEFELRWFCQKNLKGVVLSHSKSDFEGSPQMAASLWLELESEKKQDNRESLPTRWDVLMSAALSVIESELELSHQDEELQKNKLSLEFNLENYQPVPVGSDISLSAGSLKKFFDCPFQFYSEKVLKLKDQNELDLDVDPMFQGQIWHKMVEDIHNQYPDLNISRENLDQLYEQAIKNLDIDSPLKRFWVLEKPRHMMIIYSFLEVEREWRKKFTTTKTIATEVGIKGYIGVEDDKVKLKSTKANDTFHPFSGRIDRVDQDSKGYLAVIDYKTSQSNLKAFKNWPQNGQFQMPLYALALEAGLAEGIEASQVMSASYFFFKDKKRGLGYVLDQQGHEFGDLTNSKRIPTDDKEDVFDGLLKEIQQIFTKMRAGFFRPEPRDIKICDRCQWSRVCRAPHLK